MSARNLLGTGLAAGPTARLDLPALGVGATLAAVLAYLAARRRRG